MAKEIVPEVLEIPTWRLSDAAIGQLITQKVGSDNAVKAIVAEADSVMTRRAGSVIDKKPTPPSGDKRDYMSLAIYVWPDPNKPDGLPYFEKDGIVNPEIHDYDLPRLFRMIYGVEALTLAAVHTGRAAYAEKAAEIMRVWFIDEKTAMRPHLDYGQFVPGVSQGRCYGIIETLSLIKITNAVRMLEYLTENSLIEGFCGYSGGAAMRQWFAQYANWLQTSELGIAEANTTNNHRVWHLAQLVSYLTFSGNAQTAQQVLQPTLTDILQCQMAEDGSMPRELARTRSFHYAVFVMVPMLICVDVATELGIDLLGVTTESGASIAKGINWLLPYLSGNKSWTWQQIIEESPHGDVYPTLRMAANILKDPAIEEVLKKIAASEYDDLLMNLVLPPHKA